MEGFNPEPKIEDLKAAPNNESTINKIVGGTESEQDKIEHLLSLVFENQELMDIERDPTPEEKVIIDHVLSQITNFVQSYGATPVAITPDNIHIIDQKLLNESADPDYSGIKEAFNNESTALFSMLRQSILLRDLSIVSRTQLAKGLAHELIHASGFQSVTIKKVEGNKTATVIRRRSGTQTYNRDDSENYLTGIEEAIVTELTKRFYEQCIKNDPLYTDEQRQTEEARNSFASKDLLTSEDINNIYFSEPFQDDLDFDFYEHEYQAERQQLYKIIGDILEKFPERFKTTEDVFQEFVKAHATGRILSIARLIEETYKDKKIPGLKGKPYSAHLNPNNKKKAFRLLAERTKHI